MKPKTDKLLRIFTACALGPLKTDASIEAYNEAEAALRAYISGLESQVKGLRVALKREKKLAAELAKVARS